MSKGKGIKSEALKLRGFKNNTLKNKGFSLLELLVSMSLFGFTLLATFTNLIEANSMLINIGVKNKALILASSYHETLRVEGEPESLEKHWQESLERNLAGAKVSTKTVSGRNQINLSWKSANPFPMCNKKGVSENSEKQDEKDCLTL